MNQSIATIARAGLAPVLSPSFTPLIGGTPSSPTAPLTAAVLTSGFTNVFTPDGLARFFYFVDGSGNLWRWDAFNPAAAATQILAASAIGATILTLRCSPDSTALYAATTSHTVLKILTAAPYTVTTLAGSAIAGSADGTGAAAQFNTIASMVLDPTAGAFLIVHEGDTGHLRKIVVATGVVTTPVSNPIGAAPAGVSSTMDWAGNYYFASDQVISSATLTGTGGTIGSFPSQHTGPVAVSPSGQYLYTFASGLGGGASLIRIAVAGATVVPGISIVPHPVCAVNLGQMHFTAVGLFFVDSTGVLYQVLG